MPSPITRALTTLVTVNRWFTARTTCCLAGSIRTRAPARETCSPIAARSALPIPPLLRLLLLLAALPRSPLRKLLPGCLQPPALLVFRPPPVPLVAPPRPPLRPRHACRV